jgi:hypothetical protein
MSNEHLSEIKTNQARNMGTSSIKLLLGIPSTLHSTLVCIWLSLAIGSRMGLRGVWITHHVEQVQYVEQQENHILLMSLSV